MNTIFIGPYRQNNAEGYFSESILQYLYNHKPDHITCRPIYINNYAKSKCKENLSKAEKSLRSGYDVVVQHTLPEMSVYIPNVKNFLIPITNNRIVDYSNIASFRLCDKILVDNILDYNLIYNVFPDKVFLFDYEISLPEIKTNNINMGIYNHMRKLYFIGDYSDNIDLLKDLVVSFISLSKYRENICLVLFLTNTLPSVISTLKEFSENVYKGLKITNVVNKTIFLSVDSTLENLYKCHKSCDILVNISESSRNTLHKKYAKYNNNDIIDLNQIEFYASFIRNGKIESDKYLVPLQSSLIRAIEQILNNPKTENSVSSTPLEKLIWN